MSSQPRSSYLFDSSSDLGAAQLSTLSVLYDRYTTTVLDPLDLPSEPRCLEIGAGNGSIARWCAEQRSARVLAVDLDIDHLPASEGVEVRQYDISDGAPDGPYDLIHARCLFAHLPNRMGLFEDLVASLAPGGWLVLGDPSATPRAITMPDKQSAEAWERYVHTAYEIVGPAAGQAYTWADQAPEAMLAAGLTDVGASRFTPMTVGGDISARYHLNLSAQAEKPLLAAGLSEADLAVYRESLLNPKLRAWFFGLTYAFGRR